MDFQRVFLFAGLAMVLMLLWQSWIQYDAATNPIISEEGNGLKATGSTGGVLGGSLPDAGQDLPKLPDASTAGQTTAGKEIFESADTISQGGERVVVETDVLRAVIDTRGGDLRVLDLLTYPVSLEEPDNPFRLLKDTPEETFVIQSGLLGSPEAGLPNHKETLFSSVSPTFRLESGENVTATLVWSDGDGVVYRKLYTFYRDSYFFDITFEIENGSSKQWTGFLYGQIKRTEPPQEGKMGFFGRLPSYSGGAIYTAEDKYDKIKFGEMREGSFAKKTSGGWIAMLQHYFVGAILLSDDSNYELYSQVIKSPSGSDNNQYNLGFTRQEPTLIAPGGAGSVGARLYVGPKEQKRMITADQKLELTVDYGWLTPLSSPLFWLMTYINKVFQNWGVSILLLTLLVKLAFYPLSAASYKSMARMKKLGPRMKTLKERYSDDKQKFQQEMMAIYKKEKVNPLGGCLPILIQIPVFIALYWVLLESVELRQAPFALWIKDLSIQDPYYVLPILMGVSMFAQQFLNPTPPDPIQQKIMMALPVVFTFFFLWFPAGLVLYWLANNVLSISQQWFITRKIESAKT